ncbi:hypothetical protein H9657_18360 [Cellulomonas sp. Sa3CUA2]|uniref:ESAT-6-like protein n=1 Tax=Cellulomonas avistercoris TaxID=2762242 RepID=A0ABR8QII3_9CELL|nr:hypothetical protein [Cellulomonas avistercoris]MBD7920240.1 hypothetical protein [Cellulomonas avistercoris]
MPDLVVTDDLEKLADELTEIISAFKDATNLEDSCDGVWGQHNANLSMGDFADNWQHRRKDLVEKLEGFQKAVAELAEAWADTDRQLAASLEG